MIRVLVADDQALVRGGFRVLVDSAPDLEVVGEAGDGTEAVALLARYLFEERGHHRITIDPAAHNERAIRSYAKVGFRPVGVMRRYERGPDGTFHDGLLMDLLRDELTQAKPRRA